MKLSRRHLHDFNVAGHMDLFRREIEGPLSGNCALKIKDGVYLGSIDLAQQMLGPTHRDLGLQGIIGVYLQVVGRVVKLQRNGHRNLNGGIAPHHPPQQHRDRERDHLEGKVFQDILAKKIA
jgi:hypothetical protein